ncbi:uncharacterized protein BDW43DRAFT_188371 [Aspergillus alliaceus]|uniref:uncharacterized protein n=1 Tax=Petromyces alliaceus TaxID=209559 RepID=UPI0012A768A1|nr:uncharacterized protein BDW43DRAFT_188371 [Aspergillus alliaceus]KAB8229502.1 hypothetical protein BDW43DRAFT_188371 [Aspergillus alliaceus]
MQLLRQFALLFLQMLLKSAIMRKFEGPQFAQRIRPPLSYPYHTALEGATPVYIRQQCYNIQCGGRRDIIYIFAAIREV